MRSLQNLLHVSSQNAANDGGGFTTCTNVLWENQKFWPHLIWYIRHDHHGNAREALFWFEWGMVGSKIVRFSPNSRPNFATAMASIVCECCTTKGATVPVHVETASHLQRLEEPWSRKGTFWSSHLEYVCCVGYLDNVLYSIDYFKTRSDIKNSLLVSLIYYLTSVRGCPSCWIGGWRSRWQDTDVGDIVHWHWLEPSTATAFTVSSCHLGGTDWQSNLICSLTRPRWSMHILCSRDSRELCNEKA